MKHVEGELYTIEALRDNNNIMDDQEPYTSIANFINTLQVVKAVRLTPELEAKIVVQCQHERGAKLFCDNLGAMFAMMCESNFPKLLWTPENVLATLLTFNVYAVNRQGVNIYLSIRDSKEMSPKIHLYFKEVREGQFQNLIEEADEMFEDKQNDGTYSGTPIEKILQARNLVYLIKRLFDRLSDEPFDPNNPDDDTLEQKILSGEED